MRVYWFTQGKPDVTDLGIHYETSARAFVSELLAAVVSPRCLPRFILADLFGPELLCPYLLDPIYYAPIYYHKSALP